VLQDLQVKVYTEVTQKQAADGKYCFVLNISLGISFGDDSKAELLERIVELLMAADVVVVFSSGNCRNADPLFGCLAVLDVGARQHSA